MVLRIAIVVTLLGFGSSCSGDTDAREQRGGITDEDPQCGDVPRDGLCPEGTMLFSGGEVDEDKDCVGTPQPLVCSVGATAARTCWRKVSTGARYILNAGPCFPSEDFELCESPAQGTSLQDCDM